MKITRITIGRLFNLGSYEHIRYELTCEVAEGASAATAARGLKHLIASLNPKMPGGVHSEAEIKREALRLEGIRALTKEDFDRNYGHVEGGRSAYQKRVAAGIIEQKARLKKWQKQRARARKLFDDLGGVSKYHDAKDDWDNDDF